MCRYVGDGNGLAHVLVRSKNSVACRVYIKRITGI